MPSYWIIWKNSIKHHFNKEIGPKMVSIPSCECPPLFTLFHMDTHQHQTTFRTFLFLSQYFLSRLNYYTYISRELLIRLNGSQRQCDVNQSVNWCNCWIHNWFRLFLNSWHTRGWRSLPLITLANRLDPNQSQQNVGTDLRSRLLIVRFYFSKCLGKTNIFFKILQTKII